MTFEEIVAILKDNTRTEYQRAADIHAALTKASQPSAFNVKPDKPRKKREPRAPKLSPVERVAQLQQVANGSGRNEEATHEQ